ncbi:hypothetical protein CEP50_17860, partial [Actinopolyspora mortivallis]
MPEKPRENSSGHQRSHSEWGPSAEDAGNETSERAKSRRRRRALGNDGTGGTRVGDLLSKHGKRRAQSTGSHRRAAEDDAEDDSDTPSGTAAHRSESPESGAAGPAADAAVPPTPGNPVPPPPHPAHGAEDGAARPHGEPGAAPPEGNSSPTPNPEPWRSPADRERQLPPAPGGSAPPPVDEVDDTTRIPPFRGALRRPNATGLN